MKDSIKHEGVIYYKVTTKGKRSERCDEITDCADCDYDLLCEHLSTTGGIFPQCEQGFCYKDMDPLYQDLLKVKELSDEADIKRQEGDIL